MTRTREENAADLAAEEQAENELVTRAAPYWAWQIIDDLLMRAETDLDHEGDLIVPGSEGPDDEVLALRAANIAMIRATETEDQPISRREIDALLRQSG
jgi:hypothetical protein